MNQHRFVILLAACFLFLAGCENAGSRKERYIREMIKGGLSVKSQVMRDSKGIMKDMKVYRDGEKDGVVFEYIYSEGVQVDKSQLTEQSVKQAMLSEFKNDDDAKFALNTGIYVKIIYKSSAGKEYTNVTISKDDL